MSFFNNLNLSKKIFLFASLITIVFLAGIVWLGNGYRHEIERVAEKKLMAATDTAWGIIDFYSQQAQKGELSTSEAQNLAKNAIKALRFENNTYFWINDAQPKMIMHPIKPELDGQDLSRTEDPDGLRLFVEMVNATRDKPAGFVRYKWPKPGKETPQPKLSYVKKHPAWQWIIGSGIYIDDLQANINQLYYMIATVCLAGLFITLALIVLFSRSIAKPLKESVHMLDEIEKGHYQIRLNLNRKDEIGLLGQAMDQLANNFETVLLPTLNRLAEGDITFKPVPRDDNDGTRLALKQVSDNLNRTIIRIQSSAKQIGNASGQVADASQSLSQGATESAASLEEISSSLSQLSSQTQLNAENATQVNQLSSEARQLADNGNDKMKTMVAAMTDISDSSQNISKIIKVIDEIAFQTNLLALNAAVEAARAGQHGKGFAVVAEEVRNLAARSAKAASETAELIAGSVQKTDNGAIIANQTAKALEEILGSVAKVSDLAEEIAAASNEQAQGIGQINQGLGQIDQVIQQNTATAEQSAATAEELSGQAQELVHLLSQFQLRAEFTEQEGLTPRPKTDGPKILPPGPEQKSHRGETKNKTSEVPGSTWKDLASPNMTKKATKPVIALDDEEFGRY